jgi:hypothetical protein
MMDDKMISDSEREPSVETSSWAKPVQTLTVGAVPHEAINLNVDGRQLAGPLRGFGQLWQKSYRIRLENAAVGPHELIRIWKARFPEFWPGNNYFYGSVEAIKAGDVALLNLAGPGGASISTGILVIYADDESFSFMTPQGHIFAGMNTFSAYEEAETTVAEIQVLVRASDPIYELGCRLGIAHRQEDLFWRDTLVNLANAVGATEDQVEQQTKCVDPRLQWGEAKNVWHNAAIRTMLHRPLRAGRRLLGREK